MKKHYEKSTSRQPQTSSSGNSQNDAGDFECNICFELAQDPVVTLCGHLFCWPCLYKWLHLHSHSQECPVCKALIVEDKLVPLYGRGKTSTDPRSKSVPGVEIPHRPSGQRPETAPPPPPPSGADFFSHQQGMGGFAPMATTRFGNFQLSAAFGGLFPSLFNIQVHQYPGNTVGGTHFGFPYGVSSPFYGGHTHRFPQQSTSSTSSSSSQGQQALADSHLKNIFLIVGFLVLLALVCA